MAARHDLAVGGHHVGDPLAAAAALAANGAGAMSVILAALIGFAWAAAITRYEHRRDPAGWWGQRIGSTRWRRANLPAGSALMLALAVLIPAAAPHLIAAAIAMAAPPIAAAALDPLPPP